MDYKGKLYGKIGNKYFDTGKTSEDWDRLESNKVELPSDEDIEDESESRWEVIIDKDYIDSKFEDGKAQGFIEGAKWIKEKLTNKKQDERKGKSKGE